MITWSRCCFIRGSMRLSVPHWSTPPMPKGSCGENVENVAEKAAPTQMNDSRNWTTLIIRSTAEFTLSRGWKNVKKKKQDCGKGKKGVPQKRFQRLPLGKFFHAGGKRISGGSSSSDGAESFQAWSFFLERHFLHSLHRFYIHYTHSSAWKWCTMNGRNKDRESRWKKTRPRCH